MSETIILDLPKDLPGDSMKQGVDFILADQVEVMVRPQETVIKRPDVSVLIPAYNARHTLHRAWESAFFQEGLTAQVVIADDGSTDDTATIAMRRCLRENYIPGTTILRENRTELVGNLENKRIAETLNLAGEYAAGRYIIRLDSDDWYEPGCLAAFVQTLDAHPDVDFVYGARKYHGRRSDVYTPRPFSRAEFDLHNAAGYCYLMRRKVWDEGLRWRALGTFGGRVIDLEDWQHLQAMLALGYKGLALPDVLALHHVLRWDGTWGELKAVEAEALAEFKRLWPNVQAVSL